MAGLKELLKNIGDWGVSWRDRAIAAEATAEAEKARADAAVAALETALAEDAIEDEEQIAAAVKEAVGEATAAAQQKWDELQALDAPAVEPPAEEDEPHVEHRS